MHLPIAHADGRRLGEQDRRERLTRGPAARAPSPASRAVLLHLHRRVEHVERAGRYSRSISGPNSCGFMSSISHSMDDDGLASAAAAHDRSPTSTRRTFGCSSKILVPGAVADRVQPHRRQRTEASRVRRHQQRAGRRRQLPRHARRVDRRAPQQPRGCRGRHREHAVRAVARCRCRRSAARQPRGRAEPLHPEHRADDVDDRVEGADLVQVDAIERHIVNRRLRLRQPTGTVRDRAILALARQRRALDAARDLLQAVMAPACA